MTAVLVDDHSPSREIERQRDWLLPIALPAGIHLRPLLVHHFVGISRGFSARPAVVHIEIILLIIEHLRARSVLAVVLKKPVLLRIQPRGNFVFDGFAERFVGLRIVSRSVMLAEGTAVGADFELLFSADDVSALRAVEKHRVDRAHAMAFRFGCW